MILILLVNSLLFYFTNLVFVSPHPDLKTTKFQVESPFVERKHLEGIYLVCELRSAKLNVIR